ncbi:MAG: hypothetical protein GHCLOJNM_03760 [bacterium]|nr:hypothetical protein [bacterium]
MPLLDPYTGPWTESEAAHLARRAGFGASPSEITALVGGGAATDMEAAVDSLIDYDPVDAALEAEILALPSTTDFNNIKNPTRISHLGGWWLYRMVHSTQPLQEQFTLFLHNMLVSEYTKVQSGITNNVNAGNDGSDPANQVCATGTLPPDPNRKRAILVRMMRDQNNLFRTGGHLRYRDTLRSITRDPAMLIYLDNRQNVKNRPQENYAREIMELFSMGVGNYSEDDVREVARAFTGEGLDQDCADDWPYAYEFQGNRHDTNAKTVFADVFNLPGPGQDTDHVIDLILSKVSVNPPHASLPAASIFLAWKLVTWFVNEDISITDPAVLELADFLANDSSTNGYNYDFREAMRKLLKSSFFFDPAHRYTMYKHPADYVAMALRTLGANDSDYTRESSNNPGGAQRVAGMGMTLFNPPNVAGWNHGTAWITSGNLINRFNYADRVSKSSILTDAYCDGLIPSLVADEQDHAGMIEYFRARLIQTALRPEEVTILQDFLTGVENSAGTATQKYRRKIRGLAHLFMTLPQYQLK